MPACRSPPAAPSHHSLSTLEELTALTAAFLADESDAKEETVRRAWAGVLQREYPPRCYFLEYRTQCEVVDNQMRTLIALSGTDDNMQFELSEGSFVKSELHRGV
eukprot:1051868-Prymnesium_polylepis.1